MPINTVLITSKNVTEQDLQILQNPKFLQKQNDSNPLQDFQSRTLLISVIYTCRTIIMAGIEMSGKWTRGRDTIQRFPKPEILRFLVIHLKINVHFTFNSILNIGMFVMIFLQICSLFSKIAILGRFCQVILYMYPPTCSYPGMCVCGGGVRGIRVLV